MRAAGEEDCIERKIIKNGLNEYKRSLVFRTIISFFHTVCSYSDFWQNELPK